MRPPANSLPTFAATVGTMSLLLGCNGGPPPVDAAKAAGKTVADFLPAPNEADFFKDMDGGIALTPEEVQGRNTWLIWTAGNDAFWDYIANHSLGGFDLLKVISSPPDHLWPEHIDDYRKFGRNNRFEWFGLINEPGFRTPTADDTSNTFGLWLDVPGPDAEPESTFPDYYGRASGVVGLRLFPNPEFDDAARAKWDAVRYYTDRDDYYYDPKLVRPYRVGVACAWCHVGPNPVNPPADPEHPEWTNLSSNVGAQYMWAGRIFGYELKPTNFLWQMFNSWPPGALETSLVATDNINNPRTMNAVYHVPARLAAGEDEVMAGGNFDVTGLEDLDSANNRANVPHVLKDGSDAVGLLGALTRVYVNIGEHHEEWLRHFRPLVGGKEQTPFEIAVAKENSVYYQTTAERVGNLAKFFLTDSTQLHRLASAPGGSTHLTNDQNVLSRGKRAFAQACASCHSSKQPPDSLNLRPPSARDGIEQAPDPSAYQEWMLAKVLEQDFLDGNYLSSEKRYRVTDLGTNICAALATNSLAGQVWSDFSSQTFKMLPAVGHVDVYEPVGDSTWTYEMPGGGRGYLRAPSLISMWSTAPYLHNNSVGLFNADPSVAGRIEAFEDGVKRLLWREERLGEREMADTACAKYGNPSCSPIYLTTDTSDIVINKAFVPKALRPLFGLKRFIGMGGNQLRIGPIPDGVPVGLLTNINVRSEGASVRQKVRTLIRVKKALARIRKQGWRANSPQAREVLRGLVPDLLALSKCPDFVVNRGHEYGNYLSDEDKRALIEFLKTM